MATPTHSRLYIMYGSQTGTSESIAQAIQGEAKARGFAADVYVLDHYDKPNFARGGLYVFVSSSTGDGDPPDNALKCFRMLRKLKGLGTPFKTMEIACLGLGDTNYSNFCKSPKRLRKQLLDLGATEFYPPALADDATGLEETVDPWIEGLWPVLETKCRKTLPVQKLSDKVAALSIDDVSAPAAPAAAAAAPAVPEVAPAAAAPPAPATAPAPATSAAPALYSIPACKDHTFGKLAIADLPDLAAIGALTNLPKLAEPAITVTFTGVRKPVDSDVSAFHHQFASPITKSFEPPFSAHKPVLATVAKTRVITSPGAVKDVVEMEFTVPEDKAWTWQPGDAFGVCAPNDHATALALAHRVGGLEWVDGVWESPVVLIHGINGDDDLPMALRDRPLRARPAGAPDTAPGDGAASLAPRGHYYSVYELFRYVFDPVGTPKKALLRALAEATDDDTERRLLLLLCSKQGTALYRALAAAQAPSPLHVLESVPSARPPLASLLSHLAPLTPRYYSHAQTPLRPGVPAGTLAAIFNRVEYTVGAEPAPRRGLASSWLAGLKPGDVVPVFPHPSAHFHLPHDATVPLLMIGPGTGIAPLLGMVRHRAAQRAMAGDLSGTALAQPFGEISLVQGCRDPKLDWLAGDELQAFEGAGTLARYTVAFSRVRHPSAEPRADGEKYYVQDALREHAKTLVAPVLASENGKVLVCGDAKAMARQVMDAVTDILAETRGIDRMEAVKEVMELVKRGRYLQDLW
ncbi:hypothetical protein H9P43_005116 [Blastocladiella emersonii ATCC 22665]|nr:hypothetical protein H9P43_005116 [Blastocladiella emersonii ATCC 22665]